MSRRILVADINFVEGILNIALLSLQKQHGGIFHSSAQFPVFLAPLEPRKKVLILPEWPLSSLQKINILGSFLIQSRDHWGEGRNYSLKKLREWRNLFFPYITTIFNLYLFFLSIMLSPTPPAVLSLIFLSMNFITKDNNTSNSNRYILRNIAFKFLF